MRGAVVDRKGSGSAFFIGNFQEIWYAVAEMEEDWITDPFEMKELVPIAGAFV